MSGAPTSHARSGHALPELLQQAGIRYTCTGDINGVEITGVTDDSRHVTSGNLFVAVRGTCHDGNAYITQAVAAGARAVVVEQPPEDHPRVPLLVVANAGAALARLSAVTTGLAGLQSAQRLSVIGVTGTNGKTTTCYMIRHILDAAGQRPALLGTIQYDLIGRTVEASWTTPPPCHLNSCIVESHGHGASHVVMEVSSHALSQRRTDGVRFDVGVFTNLSGDHLDYHDTMEEYARAKQRLIRNLDGAATAIVNADDPASERMVRECAATVRRYGFDGTADVTAESVTCGIHGSRFTLHSPAGAAAVSLPLVGRHNVSNALAAAAACLAQRVELNAVAAALNCMPTVPGRLQPCTPPHHPYAVFVDYAHTDDALRNVLSALRPLTRGALCCVFGCGGDRDRGKRPRMAAVAQHFADHVVVTSDNPRTEAPAQIITDIAAGFDGNQDTFIHIEPDRRQAIRFALQRARADDVILIAGKGHEDYQIVGSRRRHFDDREEVRRCLGGFVETEATTTHRSAAPRSHETLQHR